MPLCTSAVQETTVSQFRQNFLKGTKETFGTVHCKFLWWKWSARYGTSVYYTKTKYSHWRTWNDEVTNVVDLFRYVRAYFTLVMSIVFPIANWTTFWCVLFCEFLKVWIYTSILFKENGSPKWYQTCFWIVRFAKPKEKTVSFQL